MSENPPFVVSEVDRARKAPQRWDEHYRGWSSRDYHKKRITAELLALPEADRTPERIAAIIGNDSWSAVECDQCGERVPVAVTVGQPPDYESSTATICEPCLRRALALLEGYKP